MWRGALGRADCGALRTCGAIPDPLRCAHLPGRCGCGRWETRRRTKAFHREDSLYMHMYMHMCMYMHMYMYQAHVPHAGVT